MSFSGLTRKSECIYYNHFEIVAQDANDIWNLLDITVPEQGGGMSVANHGHSDPNAVRGTPGITNDFLFCQGFFYGLQIFF